MVDIEVTPPRVLFFYKQEMLSGDWGPAKQIVDSVAAIEEMLAAPTSGIVFSSQ